jgi:hypothetical protein
LAHCSTGTVVSKETSILVIGYPHLGKGDPGGSHQSWNDLVMANESLFASHRSVAAPHHLFWPRVRSGSVGDTKACPRRWQLSPKAGIVALAWRVRGAAQAVDPLGLTNLLPKYNIWANARIASPLMRLRPGRLRDSHQGIKRTTDLRTRSWRHRRLLTRLTRVILATSRQHKNDPARAALRPAERPTQRGRHQQACQEGRRQRQ